MPFHRVRDPEKLTQLIESILDVTADADLPTRLDRLVERSCALVGSRYGALGILDPDGTTLRQFVTCGMTEADRAAIGDWPTGKGILGLVIRRAEPVRLADLSEHPGRVGFPPNHPPMRSFMGVPVRVHNEMYGNLYLADKADGAEFTDEDEALVEALAQAAAAGIESAQLVLQLREQTLVEDRDRIARDLHDTIIQRLFAVGLSLQGASHLAERPEVRTRIAGAVSDLDETIRDLRTAIFDLEHPAAAQGIRENLLEVVEEMIPTLGFRPQLTFLGPVAAMTSAEIAENLVAATREALTNVARHAHAQRVRITVSAAEDIALEVADDGVGLPPEPREVAVGHGHGLANLAARAGKLGGTFHTEARDGGGTRVVWQVPTPPAGSPSA